MLYRKAFLVITACATVALAACNASTNRQVASADSNQPQLDETSLAEMSRPQKADYYLEHHEWIKLRGVLEGQTDKFKSAQDIRDSLEWSEKRLFEGGPIIIAYPFAANTWKMGEREEQTKKTTTYKDDAGVLILYAMTVSMIDGQRCVDKTAGHEAFKRTITNWLPTLKYVSALPTEQKELELNHYRPEVGRFSRPDDLQCNWL